MLSCSDYLVIQYLYHWVCFLVGIDIQYKVFKHCDHFHWCIHMPLCQVSLSSVFQLSSSRPIDIQPVICHSSLVYLHSYLGPLSLLYEMDNQRSEDWTFSFSISCSKAFPHVVTGINWRRNTSIALVKDMWSELSAYAVMPSYVIWAYHFDIIRNCCKTHPVYDFISW